MPKPEVYVHVDIEADGPIPGPYSMLNVGLAAFQAGSREPVATFEANLAPLEGATQHPDTMEWWAKHPEAWKYVTTNPQDPEKVMKEIVTWGRKLPARPILTVFPTYDFPWMRWYLVRFCGLKEADLYGFAALDLKTLMAERLNIPFRQASKRGVSRIKPHWFEGCPKHDHTGLTDAIGQGVLHMNILADRGVSPEEG